MNCKKIKDLLITDYIDGELSSDIKYKVEQHLLNCSECRRFEEVLQKKVLEPFRGVQKVQPPDVVWEGIKESIVTPKESPIFIIRRPVFALAAAVALIFLTTTFTARLFFINTKQVTEYIEEQADFFTYLDTGVNGFMDGEDEGLGTSIEEYFF